MKQFRVIWIWVALFLIGCTNTSVKEEQQQGSRALSCDNQRMLLKDSTDNWRIPLDSIQTMDEYIERCRVQMKGDEYDATQHPKVYPFVAIDSVEVSLMQLLRPSGGGYFSNTEEVLRIYVDDVKEHSGQYWVDTVYNFFLDYTPKQVNETYQWNWLPGPMVSLVVRNEAFPKVEFVMKVIVEGYVKAQQSHAEHIFKKELCVLNSTELFELKNRLPFRIRLLGQLK